MLRIVVTLSLLAIAFDALAQDSRPADRPGAPGTLAPTPTSQPALRRVDPPTQPATRPAKPSDDARTPREGMPDIDEARRRYESGKVIEARHELNAMLTGVRTTAEQTEIRTLLEQIANETIFSKRVFADDPLVEWYTVQPGDKLITIAKRTDAPFDAIILVNGLSDPKSVRANSKLKLIKGPFHAKVYKSAFRLDLYVQELYVRSYRVGLGADRGTPEGVWRVKNRLRNPTYFPPETAPDRRAINANDPKNPLGEHWIGLEGIDGDAKGQEGFGIHGTIEPESIGRNASQGCVRMDNDDVATIWALLAPDKSTVTILP